MSDTLFDPTRFAALAERLESEGLAAGADIVELPSDRLSGAELRLWFIDHFEPGTAVYTIAAGLRLRGPFDEPALRLAVEAVAARHDALRCRFPTVSGIPSAVIDAVYRGEPTFEEVAGDPTAWAEEHARRPFDLGAGPLFRVAVGSVDAEDHVLLVAIHHIVVDGAGLDIVLRELLAAYTGAELPSGTDLRRVREPSAERARVDLDFWRSELAGLPPEVSVARDHERPLVPTHHGSRIGVSLDGRDAVEDCARRLRSTPAIVYHAACRCLLALFSNADDIGLGCPVSLRETDELDAVGNFVNTLVIRTSTPGDPTFAEVIAAVAKATGRALTHRRLGFDHVVRALAPGRDASHSPLFQVSFTHHSSPLPESVSVGGLTVSTLPVETGTAMFDLALQVAEWRDSVRVHLAYASDLYEDSTAERLLAAYGRIVAAGAANPGLRLSQLPLLDPAEERRVLEHAVPRAPEVDDRLGIAGRVAAAAAERPHEVALVAGGRSFTYAELEARSVELAAALEALALPTEAAVALLLEPDFDLVAAMLACARLGHPYVPLDVTHPRQRIADVFATARPGAVVGTARLVERLDCPLPPVVDPSRVHGGFAPLRPVPLHTAMYMIFTSGSSGRPKGVVVTHRNLLALVDATRPLLDYGPDDAWTLFFSCAFDFSVWEIWAPLTTGGRIVVLDRATARDPLLILDVLDREQVTVLNQTPSAFRTLQHALIARGRGLPANLRLVVFGGEALIVPELRGYFALAGPDGPRLVNMYGITETTVHVTAFAVAPGPSPVRSPIGIPLPHMSTVVLDRRLRPVPVGVPGELFVGGHGVARGYARQPGLTARRFVPDPYDAGSRLYRTGDRVRQLPDGSLEFLARVDDQVKVRGYRVEPGEIEAALLDVDGIVVAAVVVDDDRLVAFVVGNVEPNAARRSLAERLPDYLVPAAIVIVPALPLTPNGKFDRHALTVPVVPSASTEYVAPRGHAQEVLAAAFAAVLGLERVGIHDNFFELGGDSMRAVQVAAQAAESGVAVTVADLFAHPILATLAEAATEVQVVVDSEPYALVAAEDRSALPAGVVDAYPLTALQAGMLFHQEYGAGAPAYHNITSLEIAAQLDADLLAEAVDRVVARHPALRTSFDVATYSEPLQLVWESASAPVVVHDVRDLPRPDQERVLHDWMAASRRSPLPLDEPPLLRLHVHRAADDDFWLSFVECHAILDGWSFNATIEEILDTYATLLAGDEPPSRPEPPVAFREHVAAERAALVDESVAAYFADLLAGVGSTEPAMRSGAETGFHRRLIPLSRPVQRQLEATARESGLPLKSLLLAAHAVTVGLLAHSTEIVTGVILNGRPERAGGDDVRGLYLNTLPLRLSLSGHTFRSLAADAAAGEAELWRYRHYPGTAIRHGDGTRIAYSTDLVYNRFWPLASMREDGAVELLGNPREIADATTPFSVAWDHDAREPSEHLALTLECARASFTEHDTDAIAALYKRIVAALVDELDQGVGEVALLDAAEDTRLRRWNDTVRPYADGETPLHVLVERSVRTGADRVAVVTGERTLTYGELDAEANQLARVLRRRGVGVEVLVAVAISRSWRVPVVLLATLKAGGAFVPIDPEYPEERRALMVADTGAQVVLDDAALAAALAEAATESASALEVPVPPESACYVMFTSGSTGRPKGVVVPHGAIVNRLLCVQERYRLTGDDAVLLKASPSFDVSISELFWPLVAGARIVVAPPGAERDHEKLAEVIEREGVTVCEFTPSAVRAFVDGVEPERCASLRFVYAGGEVLPSELAAAWRRRFRARIDNGYGPTETAVDVTSGSTDGPLDGPTVPIGFPHVNTGLHVLGGAFTPLPRGIAGELHIGGAQLARGYHASPGLTAARFVPNPFGPAGSRLYRTGDRVRRLEDGAIEWLGRVDDQVKVRGFRVEPGEVEAALRDVEAVTGAAVVLRDGRLVAFVTGDVADTGAVRNALAARLARHLVPSVVVALAELPLTPNGKIDHSSLPIVAVQRPVDLEYVAPRDRTEELLASVFASVLGVECVGVHDNFFALGGDSILSLTCAMRARAAGLQLSPSVVFQYQTVAAIAPHALPADVPTSEAFTDATDAPDLSLAGLDEDATEALLARVREVWQ